MLDRLEGGEDEEDRRAQSLVEGELERALKTTEELSKEPSRGGQEGQVPGRGGA